MNTKDNTGIGRRNFLKKSLGVALTAPLVASFEERALLAKETETAAAPAKPIVRGTMPGGKIGSVEISRLICGGNLISGYAHSRDLIYVSTLLKHYFTDEKIMETWALCEQHGINTMVAYPGDPERRTGVRQVSQAGRPDPVPRAGQPDQQRLEDLRPGRGGCGCGRRVSARQHRRPVGARRRHGPDRRIGRGHQGLPAHCRRGGT